MTEISYQELEEQFDEIFLRVENGEHFIINYDGKQFILMPFYKYSESYIDKTTNDL